MPASRRRSSLARRSASRSEDSRSGSSFTRGAYWELRRLDLRDLELLLGAARRLHRHDVVLPGADQRLPDRGLVRKLLLGRSGLGRADDLELLGLARLLVLDVDDGADADGLGVEVLVVDDGSPAQPVLKRRDPLLQHRLLVLRVVVLGVLRDVPELTRRLDAVRNLPALVVLQVLELLLELLETLRGDQCLACQLSSFPSSSGFARRPKALLYAEK